jgi:hypothetical protein
VRTISIRPDQDRWLAEMLGGGNASAFFQSLLDQAIDGKVAPSAPTKDAGLDRAAAYMRAKEAGIYFEEDVGRVIAKWAATQVGVHVVKGRIHNTGSSFVADYSLEDKRGNVRCSVLCKSSPRADRLQLALAEAMIGDQKTGKPVIVVVPYSLDEGSRVAGQFAMLGYPLVELAGLPGALAANLACSVEITAKALAAAASLQK